MTGMHADELMVDEETVRRLVAAQFPQWSSLPVRRLPPLGTDNQLFRLGDDLLVRMPRIPGPAETVAFEHRWLPRLAPGGTAFLVVQRNLGSDSLQRWIESDLGMPCARLASSKGFRVLKVDKG